MQSAARPRAWTSENILFFSQVASLCLGIGLLLWALAPAMVLRAVTGDGINPFEMPVNFLTLTVGLIYIGLALLMQQRRRWAFCVAFLVSATIAAAAVATLVAGTGPGSISFLVLLSGVTCFANWAALAALGRTNR